MAGAVDRVSGKVNRNQRTRSSHVSTSCAQRRCEPESGRLAPVSPPKCDLWVSSRPLTGEPGHTSVRSAVRMCSFMLQAAQVRGRSACVTCASPISRGGDRCPPSRQRTTTSPAWSRRPPRRRPSPAPAGRGFLKGAAGTGAALPCPPCSRPAAAAPTPARAARQHRGAASGTVTIGSNASDAVPKKAYADVFAAFDDGEAEDHDQGQHGRPQHVPGADQQLPAGQPGRPLHLVRRLPHAASSRRRASPATSATSGTSSAATSATPSRRRRPATTASSTSCRSTTTRGS